MHQVAAVFLYSRKVGGACQHVSFTGEHFESEHVTYTRSAAWLVERRSVGIPDWGGHLQVREHPVALVVPI